VEDTLFRIPHFFLSQSSTYFAKMLAERASSIDIFQVTESDVTSPAFANLLYVLYPRCVPAVLMRQGILLTST
jgi:hypothetical protein